MTHIYRLIHKCTCMYRFTDTRIRSSIFTCIYLFEYTYTCIDVCIEINVYVYICIYVKCRYASTHMWRHASNRSSCTYMHVLIYTYFIQMRKYLPSRVIAYFSHSVFLRVYVCASHDTNSTIIDCNIVYFLEIHVTSSMRAIDSKRILTQCISLM